jgi:glycosyltransferase involved in cell wall biosynthesis
LSARRIILVSASLGAGGAERQMADMASYWVRHGVEVTLATWNGAHSPDFYELDERVRRVHIAANSPGGALPTLATVATRVRKLRALLRAERPEVVLSFMPENNVLTIFAAARLPVRVVISERAHPAHDTNVRPLWRLLRKIVYRWCDEIVAQTREAALWLQQHFTVNVRVIPNGLRTLPTPVAERQLLIVAVGRLVRQKGFDLLLRAFAQVAAEFADWQVVVLGDGAERSSLVAQRDELQLTGRVRFLGEVREVEDWLARAGLVVQPSRFEGFPNAVLEAMALGAAVISADCPAGPADLIQDGVNGRLVPVEDVSALAGAMRELLADPKLRASLGERARLVTQRFHQDRIMALWQAALLPDDRSRAAAAQLEERAQ